MATITLNRPERLNAINMAMRDLLWEYLQACRDHPDVRAVCFRGEGRAFSAGADISEFGTAPSLMEARRARHERDVWGLMLSLPVPLVARMHGFCFGAGLELPLCCDVRVAEEGTQFALPEVTLGYIPSAGGTQTLRARFPRRRRRPDPDGRAGGDGGSAALGLITKAVPAADLDEAVRRSGAGAGGAVRAEAAGGVVISG